jgi:hypothetical protein
MTDALRQLPIVFNAAAVRAILAGRKTVFRDIVKHIPESPSISNVCEGNIPKHDAPYIDAYCSEPKTAFNPRGAGLKWCWWTRDDRPGATFTPCKWKPGDRLWVREAFCITSKNAYNLPKTPDPKDLDQAAYYRADFDRSGKPLWKSPVYMPRWASRITLLVKAVRVERLWDITSEDIAKESIDYRTSQAPKIAFDQWMVNQYALLWDSIHGAGAWDVNPWVSVTTFRVIDHA